MFETKEWSDLDESDDTSNFNLGSIEILSDLCKNPNVTKHQRKRKKISTACSMANVNKNVKKAFSKLKAQNLSRQIDACLNSPSLTNALIDEGENLSKECILAKKTPKFKKSKSSKDIITSCKNIFKNPELPHTMHPEKNNSLNEVGSILKRGEKFSSESEFMKFMNQKTKKHNRAKKRSQKLENYSENGHDESTKILSSVKDITNSSSRKKRKVLERQSAKNDRDSVSLITNETNTNTNITDQTNSTNKANILIQDEDTEAKRKLKSSRFRFLNEKLYTQSGHESLKMFRNDSEGEQTFKTYHEGYAEQVKKWPLDPLDLLIR